MAKRYGKERKSKTFHSPKEGSYSHRDVYSGTCPHCLHEILVEACSDCSSPIIGQPIYLGLGHDLPLCVDCYAIRCSTMPILRSVYGHPSVS